jgi:peptidoglycan/xylan/chitin deacetylase (PgdA/CDA1 family)
MFLGAIGSVRVGVRRGKPIGATCTAVLGIALGSLSLAGAAGGTSPPAVTSASLTQQGQDLVWTVSLTRPFSAAALRRDHLSLCLLIERASGGAVRERVCFAPGRHGRPKVVVGSRVVAAVVTRLGHERLQASFLPQSVGLRYRRLRWQVDEVCGLGACGSAVPSRPQLLELHVPKLVGCQASGPTWVSHGPSSPKQIALTFDDGPWYQTPQFLSLLEHERVPATFFEIGDQIAQFGEGGAVERRMLRDGDMIGDHTWNHRDVAGGGEFARTEIVQAAAAIREATRGFTPCLFRAPYGAVSPALLSEARSLGFTTMQWDIDPRDWALPGVDEIESDVLQNAHPGGIVEMHDGGGNRSETIAALPTIIGVLRKRGYAFVTITQMLGYRLIYK